MIYDRRSTFITTHNFLSLAPKPWPAYVETSAHVKGLSNGPNYPQSCPAASLVDVVALWRREFNKWIIQSIIAIAVGLWVLYGLYLLILYVHKYDEKHYPFTIFVPEQAVRTATFYVSWQNSAGIVWSLKISFMERRAYINGLVWLYEFAACTSSPNPTL